MPGLTIVAASADPRRLRTALEIGAANCALGDRTRLFLQGEAAALLSPERLKTEPGRGGEPSLAETIEEAAALGLRIIVCQSGLALAGMAASDLPPQAETGGLVALLSTLDGDQLLMA